MTNVSEIASRCGHIQSIHCSCMSYVGTCATDLYFMCGICAKMRFFFYIISIPIARLPMCGIWVNDLLTICDLFVAPLIYLFVAWVTSVVYALYVFAFSGENKK